MGGLVFCCVLLYADLDWNCIASLPKSEQGQTFTMKQTILYCGDWKQNKQNKMKQTKTFQPF